MDITLYTILLLVSTSGILAGCRYDEELKEHTCGKHGECRETKISSLFVLRYCQCSRGYSGKESCDTICVDCCDNMAEQCRNKRYTSLCKLPKCLRRVLRSRKCPKTSPSRKKILETLHTYLSFCKKSK
ncbi:hypothetical protein EB796_009114 [Bugula neritina]|uniref:EGF-like domain-containing protein n=1 Tax=Bugula neritina TaxID=10212 RepID=A0A7J7K2U4_BUGNE|nr:hypothetical protein EB796_009114 [Bugula neritina]